MANRVKERLKQGLPATGYWFTFPSPSMAEYLASFPMDWLLIDTEHGPANYETVEDILRGMKGSTVVPLIRVAANDPALIKKALDRGAYGVLVPLVNNAEEARAAVAAAKYPPEGIRGVAGTRISRHGTDLPAYFNSWNQDSLVAVQIETKQAVENVEEIAATPGVDVLFIGPNDLSASMNLFLQYDHPDFNAAVQRVLAAANANGIAAGYMCFDPLETLEKIDAGFRFVAAGTDARLLGNAAQASLDQISQGLNKRGLA